jgi:hypothetical protein
MRYSDGQTRFIPRIHVVGSQTHPSGEASFAGRIVAFGVFFQPYALWQLFRIPSSVLVDRDYDGRDVFRTEMQDLWHMLAECKSFAERIQIVERYLLPFASSSLSPTPIVKTAHLCFI